jgi:hypothetical protein
MHARSRTRRHARAAAQVRRPDGKLVLYCKGSDEVLLDKLATDTEAGTRVLLSSDRPAD